MEELLTTKEAMEVLKIKSRNTLKEMVKKGLKCYGDGKLRRFKYSDLMGYLEGNIK